MRLAKDYGIFLTFGFYQNLNLFSSEHFPILDGILDTKTTRGNRLIELIERNNVSEFFSELDRMGIRGNEIASL